MVERRKLIEVALPLEAINKALQAEKARKVGKPQQVHHWWARRPITAARVVLFAQLVDDPSSLPSEFPSVSAQDAERRRLLCMVERLARWESAWDERLLAEAYDEIVKSTESTPLTIIDPFAGGGSIPLEAQRLGLRVRASDLNPVAVLINKALIEVPPKHAGQPPVYPGAADGTTRHWPHATGLAEDVRRYGAWMLTEAERRIGHLYPRVALADGSSTKAISWIWARTVVCANPACRAEIPLASTWWLSKKKDRPSWISPVVRGTNVDFEIGGVVGGPPDPPKQGRGAKFTCLVCHDTTTDSYVKSQAREGRLGARMLAVVGEGKRRRLYLPATDEQVRAADVSRPVNEVPDAPMPTNPRWFSPPGFGMPNFADLFTNRQLVGLMTFSDLVGEARERAARDGRATGIEPAEADSYARGLALYLGLAVSRLADWSSSMCRWENVGQVSQQTFNQQSIPMVWDYSEANILGSSSGSFIACIENTAKAVQRLSGDVQGTVQQADASTMDYAGGVVSTDPPYYDNIGYADLSDFFYIWLRRSLGKIFDDVTGTMLTPKTEELVATPYRFDGSKQDAERHFERGFVRTFSQMRKGQVFDIPMTVFYAFKQAESGDTGTASTGWEAMLTGMIEAGLMVTATWPMSTEMSSRTIGRGRNALASSIVLACRPRPDTAGATNRRGFIAALKSELPGALRTLQQGSVAPVDLAQAAIGPGMAVFTRYGMVLEADGSTMSVRTALALINQVLDETLSEQEGDFDADTRFCIAWFNEFEWNKGKFGVADTLARAKGTSVEGVQRGGVFRATKGDAWLVAPEDMRTTWDPLTDERISVWEAALHIARALSADGVDAAAALMASAGQRVDLDTVKELAYLLYNVCERRGWTQSALLFNALGTTWSDLDTAARRQATDHPATQPALIFDEDDQ